MVLFSSFLKTFFLVTFIIFFSPAIILALQLLKRENNVKLAVFTEEGIDLVSIERNFSNIGEAEFVLRVS